MAIRQYIGARYVPKFDGDWDITKIYEPLTIVQYSGNSYTSKKEVPAGTLPTNTTYWAETGNYSGQIATLDEKINNLIYINVLNPPTGCPSLDNTNSRDNTSDLQQIINYVYSTGAIGATIYFPRGIYRFDGTVDVDINHIRFLGEEMGATRFECQATTAGGQDMFYIHARFISFEHIAFWIVGDNTYENTFIHAISGSRNININWCLFYDAKNAIIIDSVAGIRFQNAWVSFDQITYTDAIAFHFIGLCNSSYMLNCVGSMVASTGTALKLEGHPQDFYVEHLETSRGAYSIDISSDGSRVVDVQFVDCVLDEPNIFGIYVHDLPDTSEVSFLGGQIFPRSNGGKGVRLENCKNIKFNALKIMNTHALTNVDGFSITGIVENILINGCYFFDLIRSLITISSATNNYKMISFNNNLVVNEDQTGGSVALYKCKAGSVSNNSFRKNITTAIIVDGSNSNIMIEGNIGLTDSAVTNNYSGAYSVAGFMPTDTNCFVIDA